MIGGDRFTQRLPGMYCLERVDSEAGLKGCLL